MLYFHIRLITKIYWGSSFIMRMIASYDENSLAQNMP